MITSGVHVHSFNLKLCSTPFVTRNILSDWLLQILFESILEIQTENKKISNIACNWSGLFNPLMPNSDLEILLCLTPGDFTLSNARRFYSSKGDPLGTKGLKNYLL